MHSKFLLLLTKITIRTPAGTAFANKYLYISSKIVGPDLSWPAPIYRQERVLADKSGPTMDRMHLIARCDGFGAIYRDPRIRY